MIVTIFFASSFYDKCGRSGHLTFFSSTPQPVPIDFISALDCFRYSQRFSFTLSQLHSTPTNDSTIIPVAINTLTNTFTSAQGDCLSFIPLQEKQQEQARTLPAQQQGRLHGYKPERTTRQERSDEQEKRRNHAMQIQVGEISKTQTRAHGQTSKVEGHSART